MSTKPQEKTELKPMTEARKAEIAELLLRAAIRENGGDTPTYAELALALVRATAKGFLIKGEDREADALDCSEALGIPLSEAFEFLEDIAAWDSKEV